MEYSSCEVMVIWCRLELETKCDASEKKISVRRVRMINSRELS